MTDKEILIKQIIYRSIHRGTKEMDLLLGNFVKKYIKTFNLNELKDLEYLINTEDTIIEKKIDENKISMIFRKFKI